MGKKLSRLMMSLFSFLPLAVSQSPFQDRGGMTSINELLQQLLGVQINDPYAFAGILASLGVLWGATYVALKTGFSKLGLEEHVFPDSRGNGRNIVAVISLLVVLSMVGTGSFATIISSWQALVGLSFAFGVVVLFIYLIFGGTGALFGGTAYIGSRAIDSTYNSISEASELFSRAEQEDQEGRSEDAIRDLERALTLLEESDQEIEEVLQADIQELEQAITEIKDEMNVDREELEDERRIQEIVEDMNSKVNSALEVIERGYQTGHDEKAGLRSALGFNDQNSIVDDYKALVNLLQDIKSVEGREMSEIQDELNKLEDAVKGISNSVELVSKLEEIVDEGEAEWEHLAQEVGDRQEIEIEQQEIQELENKKAEIREFESQAIQLLEEAREMLQQEVKVTQEEIELLNEEMREEDGLAGKLAEMDDFLLQEYGDTDFVEEFKEISYEMESDLLDAMEEIEQVDEEELQMEERVAEEIERALRKLNS